MRGGAYLKGCDPGYVPRLKWLVEGTRVGEGILHSAKRMVSKSEAPRACQKGMGGEGERRRVPLM